MTSIVAFLMLVRLLADVVKAHFIAMRTYL